MCFQELQCSSLDFCFVVVDGLVSGHSAGQPGRDNPIPVQSLIQSLTNNLPALSLAGYLLFSSSVSTLNFKIQLWSPPCARIVVDDQQWNGLPLTRYNGFLCKSLWNELASSCKQGKNKHCLEIKYSLLSFPSLLFLVAILFKSPRIQPGSELKHVTGFFVLFFIYWVFLISYNLTHRPQIKNHFPFLKVSEMRKYMLVNMLSFQLQNVNVSYKWRSFCNQRHREYSISPLVK